MGPELAGISSWTRDPGSMGTVYNWMGEEFVPYTKSQLWQNRNCVKFVTQQFQQIFNLNSHCIRFRWKWKVFCFIFCRFFTLDSYLAGLWTGSKEMWIRKWTLFFYLKYKYVSNDRRQIYNYYEFTLWTSIGCTIVFYEFLDTALLQNLRPSIIVPWKLLMQHLLEPDYWALELLVHHFLELRVTQPTVSVGIKPLERLNITSNWNRKN